MLVAAGTLAALVVSEWPRTGEMIAEQAGAGGTGGAGARSTRRAAVPGDWSTSRLSFTIDEPDPSAPGWPQLVTTGSAEEARRDLEARFIAAGPQTTPINRYPTFHGEAEQDQELADFAAREEWWRASPTGQMVDEIMAYDPGRTGATVRLSPSVGVTGGVTAYNRGDGPSVGTVELSDGSTPRDAEVYDLSVRLDALGGSALKHGISAGLIGGARSASVFDSFGRDPVVTDPLPVIGGDASIKWSDRSMLRASALGEAPGTIRDYVDLRLEHVWRLGGDASLSVGWRHMRGIMSNEAPVPTLKQDAILLELKIGF